MVEVLRAANCQLDQRKISNAVTCGRYHPPLSRSLLAFQFRQIPSGSHISRDRIYQRLERQERNSDSAGPTSVTNATMSSSVAPTAQQPNIYRDPSIPPPHPPLSFEIHQQRPLHLLNLPIEGNSLCCSLSGPSGLIRVVKLILLRLPVLHQILTSLSHPISDFLSLRLVSRHISSFITSHPALRHFILSTLPSRHPALRELSVLPPEIWSFNLLHDGWLRALLAIKRTIHEPWLKSERDLHESDWLVYFKEMLSEGVYGVGVRHEHSIIRFLGSNGTVECIGGMPLASREWRVEDGVMKGEQVLPMMENG